MLITKDTLKLAREVDRQRGRLVTIRFFRQALRGNDLKTPADQEFARAKRLYEMHVAGKSR
jgi:hypothetical protein